MYIYTLDNRINTKFKTSKQWRVHFIPFWTDFNILFVKQVVWSTIKSFLFDVKKILAGIWVIKFQRYTKKPREINSKEAWQKCWWYDTLNQKHMFITPSKVKKYTSDMELHKEIYTRGSVYGEVWLTAIHPWKHSITGLLIYMCVNREHRMIGKKIFFCTYNQIFVCICHMVAR